MINSEAHCPTCPVKEKTIFCSFEKAYLEKLNQVKHSETFLAHEKLFDQSENPKGIYIVLSGKVKTFKLDISGKIQIVRIAGPGDPLGYRALISEEPYSASAETLEKSNICFIKKDDFFKFLEKFPKVAISVMKRLALDLRQAEDSFTRVVTRSIRERLATTLLVFKKKYGQQNGEHFDLHIELSRAEFAELIGTTQESLIRLFSAFKKEGLISIHERKITLLNLPKLMDIANSDDDFSPI